MSEMRRMPTFFGPSLGPRQGPDGRRFDNLDFPRQIVCRAAFETDETSLRPLLGELFTLSGPARILFAFSYLSEIEWLAGRGYNTFGVYVPACYRGSEREYPGELNLVLWENMADPIITGREELGIAKVYCELPPPRVQESTATCTASWDGHGFAGLELTDLADASPEPAVLLKDSAGLLHHKYIPCTGEWGKADVSYPVLTPAAAPNSRVIWRKAGEGSCRFVESTWEQLPTLVHIVNALAALELGRCLFAEMFEVRGYKDISDQRRLE